MSVTQREAWHVDAADPVKAHLQEAKAEAQRVRDCQAQLSRQHQVLQAAVQLPHYRKRKKCVRFSAIITGASRGGSPELLPLAIAQKSHH